MTFVLRFSFFFFLLALPACRFQTLYPEAPGVLFIRQQICDINDFKKGFFRPENALKDHGLTAYRFFRDPKDPKTYILEFQCSSLKKAAAFLQSSNFLTACVGAGLGLPLMWGGVEAEGTSNSSRGDGLVLVRYEVRDYDVWKKAWDADLKGKTGNGRLYRLQGNPEAVIVAQQVPDILQVPSAPNSQTLEAAGVIHKDLWSGSYLERGNF